MKLKLLFSPFIVAFTLVTQPAIADSSDPANASQTVKKTLVNLVDVLRNTQLSSDEKQAQAEIHQLLEANLNEVVDFKSIVKRIMGKHFEDASKEQRNRFLEVFKNSLVTSYGKFMINSDLEELANSIEYQVLPKVKSRRKNSAQVTVLFKVDEKSYESVYSMSYSASRDKWQLVNLVVEGINLGINYRNQFDRMMVRNNKDYDKVIEEWAGADQSRLEEGQG